jgi:transposase-like protein
MVIHALATRYQAGATIAELADAFGTSRETVRRAMIEAGIPRRPRGNPAGSTDPPVDASTTRTATC